MKKRILTLFLAVFMLFAMAIPAMAGDDDPAIANSSTDDGKVIVTNAVPGVTYKLYRGFIATYSTSTDSNGKEVKNVSYYLDTTTGTDTEKANAVALYNAIKAEMSNDGKSWNEGDAPICSFNAVEVREGVYEITQKEGFPESAGRGWLWTQKSLLPLVETITATSETVTFDELAYGYYLMSSDLDTNSAVSVNSATPTVEIVDKTPRSPSTPEKTVAEYSQEIGKEATFTVVQKTVNQRTVLGEAARVMQYVLTDTMVAGLERISTTTTDGAFGDATATIKIYTGYDETTKTYTGEITNFDSTITVPTEKSGTTYYPTIAKTYDPTTGKLTITWGDAVMDNTKDPAVQTGTTSRYPDNAYIVITYKMKIDDSAYIANPDADAGGYKEIVSQNKITTQMKVDGNDSLESIGEDTSEVYSAGFSIRKLDENQKKLEGAKFVLYKLVKETVDNVETDVKYYWKWDSTNNTLTWTKESYGDDQIKTADNKTNTAEFYGLAEGTYYLKEIEAPDGYKTPADPFTVVVTKNASRASTSDQYFVITVNGTATEYNAGIGIYSAIITNYAGNALPTTGGMGTTIFYVVGSILFLSGCILLITRKRMESNN